MRLNRVVPISISCLLLAASFIPVCFAGTTLVPAAEFRFGDPNYMNAQFFIFSGYWNLHWSDGEARLYSPVELPDGATVTAFRVYYYDDDSVSGIECNLRRTNATSSGGDAVLAATFSTDDDAIDHSMADVTITNALIDNSTYTYYIEYVGTGGADGDRRLYAVAIDYNEAATSVDGESISSFGGAVAEPNPFGTSTSIRFTLAAPGPVTVDLYDVQGRRVRTIEQRFSSAGEHSLSWDGRDENGRAIAAGVYFAQVRGQGEALAAKLVRVK